MHTIELIGVAQIGMEFLERLLTDGHDVVVFDVDDDTVERATERDASDAASPAAVANRSDAAVLALPGSPEIEATLEGADGLLDALESGQLVVDVTTTHPDSSVVAEQLCDEAGTA